MTRRRHFVFAVVAIGFKGSPPGALGNRTTADLQAIVGERIK